LGSDAIDTDAAMLHAAASHFFRCPADLWIDSVPIRGMTVAALIQERSILTSMARVYNWSCIGVREEEHHPDSLTVENIGRRILALVSSMLSPACWWLADARYVLSGLIYVRCYTQ